MNNKLYVSYNEYEVIYDTLSHSFEINVKNNKSVLKSDCIQGASEDFTVDRSFNHEEIVLCIAYENFAVSFTVSKDGILVSLPAKLNSYLKTDKDTFSMCLKESDIVNSAFGPAVSSKDDCLFNRTTDTALLIDGKFSYSFEKKCYCCTLNEKTFISLKENVLAEKYCINYSSINKNCTFPTPPVGWMTWYAVKFDANEKAILDNVNWQKEHLKDYGANVIWVDWEWYHNSLNGVRDDGVDTFNPDPEKYPNGLKYIADKIKEAGFIPALWIGFTHDCSHNKYTKENPEIILTHKVSWCGQYFYDFSNPKYLEEFLPMALKQVFDWGYEAVKFDTLPLSILYHDEFHGNMYNPSLTTKEAYRNVIKKTRAIIGKDMYMLSCSCARDTDILWASDIFDGARVGEDIFKWDEFLQEGVKRVLKFYPMHNNILYTDPDNVVLREEFNTFEQAASRIYFVSMLGLPLNLGDYLPMLPKEKVNLLKECMPALDIRPKNLSCTKSKDILITNLHIALPYECYNVISVFNTTEKAVSKHIDLISDLNLDKTEYLIFDYNDKTLTSSLNSLEADLKPYETKIFCIRKKKAVIQLVSTSRHISQGAAEIKNLIETENSITITASLIKYEPYELFFYVQDGYTISAQIGKTEIVDKALHKLSFIPDKTQEYEIKITKDICI